MPFVFLAYISLFVLGLSDNIRGPTFPDLVAQYSLSDFAASFFFSISCLGGIFGSLFAPKWIHRFGEIGTLRAAHVFMACSQLGIFWASEFSLVLLSAALFGFSLALMGVCENSLVLNYADPKKMQRFQSGLHSMYALSSFVAPLVVTGVYQYQQRWQNPFVLAAVMGFCFVGLLCFVKEKKSRADQELLRSISRGGSRKEELFFACALSLYVGAELLISTRLALFAQRQWQSDFAEANFFVSMFFLFLLVGRVSFIFWQPKGRLRNHLWLSLSLTSISLVLGLLGWKWGFSLAGLFMAPVYPLMMTAAGQMFSKQIYRVTAFAISMSNVSVLVMHGLFGQLSDVYGIQIAMWGAVFLSGTSILLICLHPLVFKRSYP